MLTRTHVVYSICSLKTYTLYRVSLITNNLGFITALFICQINHYHTIIITVIHLDILLVINLKSSEEIPSCSLLVAILVFFMMRIVALLSIK